MVSAPRQALRGLAAAFHARRGTFALVTAAVFLLDIFVPPILLSVARKPLDFFTFNPWLKRLPEYLVSGNAPLGERLRKTLNLALFWFSADNLFGVEWGFAVTVADMVRFALMALIIATYFTVWLDIRERQGPAGWGARASAQGGMLGTASSIFGLATGGCTVMGCGAPVLPVVGLAFTGLSSTTLKWMAELSTVATVMVLVGMGTGVLYLGWRAGSTRPIARP